MRGERLNYPRPSRKAALPAHKILRVLIWKEAFKEKLGSVLLGDRSPRVRAGAQPLPGSGIPRVCQPSCPTLSVSGAAERPIGPWVRGGARRVPRPFWAAMNPIKTMKRKVVRLVLRSRKRHRQWWYAWETKLWDLLAA
jgi:hypothetical protein